MGEGVARTSPPFRAVAHAKTMKVENEKHRRGRWRQRPQVGQDKVKSLEAALGAWVRKTQVRGANSGSPQARTGVVRQCVSTRTLSRPRQSPRWNDSSIGRSWRARGRRHQESSQEGSGGRNRRSHQGVQGVRRISKSKTDLEIETGLLEDSRARLTRLKQRQLEILLLLKGPKC